MSAVLEHAHHATATFTITEVSHAAALLSLRDALIRESHAIVKSSVEHGWARNSPATHDRLIPMDLAKSIAFSDSSRIRCLTRISIASSM